MSVWVTIKPQGGSSIWGDEIAILFNASLKANARPGRCGHDEKQAHSSWISHLGAPRYYKCSKIISIRQIARRYIRMLVRILGLSGCAILSKQKVPGASSMLSTAGGSLRLYLPGIALLLALLSPVASGGVPAFPGAQGGGSMAVGGRGGVVCEVTNLNDSGPGSFRSCVEMSGPRTVIFRVGGTIELKDWIRIQNPYITIAGQTAPGDGIQLIPAAGMERTLIVNMTHDVIIRYLRLRQSRDVPRDRSPSVLSTWNTGSTGVYNVIYDHISMSWSPETTTGAWGHNSGLPPPKNMTWQYVIVAESLEGHSTGTNIGAARENLALEMTDIDFHNNFYAHNGHRNALLRNASGRWINNIVYDWTSWATRAGTGSHRDFIANIYKPGPSRKSSRGGEFELGFKRWDPGASSPERDISTRSNSFYVSGNRGMISGMSPEKDNWPFTREIGSNWNSGVIGNPAPMEWRRTEPLRPAGFPIAIRHVDELEDHLLPIVGASRRLDCEGNWVPARDAVDERLVEQYRRDGGYTPVEHENDVGGFPMIRSGPPCLDTSGDGIPDAWLIRQGLNPSEPIGADIHESGYSFLELFLNGSGLGAVRPPGAPSGVMVN